jgi:hypothetical protein
MVDACRVPPARSSTEASDSSSVGGSGFSIGIAFSMLAGSRPASVANAWTMSRSADY